MKKGKGRLWTAKKRAQKHLTSIAELSLCVPLSHWYFEEMHGTVTRAPHSNTHEVIEVLSLQAADDAVLGRVSSHACLCKYHFGSNNAKRLPADTYVRKEKREIQRGRENGNLKSGFPDLLCFKFLSCYTPYCNICLRPSSVL